MKKEEALKRRSKLFSIVEKANTTLIDRFFDKKGFVDKDEMSEKGLLSDAVGLTSVLLTLVAFYNKGDNNVISTEIIKKYKDVIETLIPEFFDTVQKDGYIFTPIIKRTQTNKIFSAEKRIGATDTATWILSSSVLLRYASKQKIVTLSPEIEKQTKFLIFDSLKLLLDAQRPDGTWGFGTWTRNSTVGQAKKSLYFTYSVATSLSDFYYYINGDIDEIDGLSDARDDDMIAYLNEQFGCKDIIEKVDAARTLLQDWIITNCLPLLPKIAACSELTPNEAKTLGLFASSNENGGDNDENKFFNLYYAFYIIDMIISSEVDLRFQALEFEKHIDAAFSNGETDNTQAANLLRNLRDGGLFSAKDRLYYLGLDNNGNYNSEDQHIKAWLDNYLQQAVHSSRSMFLASKRTNYFWRTSELKVEWLHDSEKVCGEIKVCYDGKFSDPSFSPMALRANADYVFYITEMSDAFLNDLFNNICGEVFDKQAEKEARGGNYNERDYEDCVPDLWDSSNYSLFVSERSLESLVDYFDYISRFEAEGKETTHAASSRTSELDAAVDSRIKQYLDAHSKASADELQALVDKAVTDRLAAVAPQDAAFETYLTGEKGERIVLDLLKKYGASAQAKAQGNAADHPAIDEQIKRDIAALRDVYESSSEPDNHLKKLIELFEILHSASLKKHLRQNFELSTDMRPTELNAAVGDVFALLSMQKEEVLKTIADYLRVLGETNKTKHLQEIVDLVIRYANAEKFTID
ncbi:MAG: hypothetical protein IJU41_02090 [Clostridia bacterium]|nr:hypothetical protein [Clostridia bacterium]